MKACILSGNTREKSNTEAVTEIFADELAARGVEVRLFKLREKDIRPCVGCGACHGVMDAFGCVIDDDMSEMAGELADADILVFSSPIYTWMPTPLLKSVVDRLYAFTKYPDDGSEFNLIRAKRFAMIATSGDECVANCDLFDEAIRRMAKFAGVSYAGYFAAQDKGREYITGKEVEDGARAFAGKCLEG